MPENIEFLSKLNDSVVEVIASASRLSETQLRILTNTLNSVSFSRQQKTIEYNDIERVYFIQNPINSLIKVGFSRKVEQRIKSLQFSEKLQIPFHVLNVTLGNRSTERAILNKFHHLKSHGEWLFPDAELLNFITEQPKTEWKSKRTKKINISPTLKLFKNENSNFRSGT